MRQHAMVSNRHAKGDEGVHRSQQPHIGPADGALPEHSSSESSSQERDKNDDEENSFIEYREGMHNTSTHPCSIATVAYVLAWYAKACVSRRVS